MGCGASSASKPLPETAAPANSPAAGPPAGSKVVTLDEILNDSKVRAWVDTLPEVCLSEATRPYTAEELAAADKLCNVDAAAPAGRKPKLIFQLGAAGTGKSTRMQDCYTEMGVSEDGIVVADGDNVRQSHVGLSAAFNMTKKSLIDAMTAAGSPELGQYTKELESFADEHPVGFKDCGKWAYQGSGPHKNAIADAALAAKKDVVMGITKKSQMTSTYKSVIDGALANGYEISAMATFVVPEELCERQVGRGKKKGRLVQWHKECTDGNIVTNAWLKQQLSIDAVDHLSALVREHSGTLMLFDNTPNYFKDPSTKQGAFWTQKGADTTVTYKGEATMAGCLTHIMSIQDKILSPAPAAAAPAPAAQTVGDTPMEQPSTSQLTSQLDGEDPALVFIVHRHGARFPTRVIKGDLSWPVNPQFWSDFGGQLTPEGSQQHVKLGGMMSRRYPHLFAGIPDEKIPDHVLCLSSNVQRTLFSAWSLLTGMFPKVPRYFCYSNDRPEVDMEAADQCFKGFRDIKSRGISINIENRPGKWDKMFHQLKTESEEAQHFKFHESEKSKEVAGFSLDPKVHELADKLYRITEFPKLGPEHSMPSRVNEFLRVFVQMEVARTHGFPALPNKHGLVITQAEEAIIDQVARRVTKHWYRPVESEKVVDGIGQEGGGFLVAEIARMLREKKSGKSELKFVHMSAHDSSILAICSLLGIDIEWVGFTGHLLFEYYPKANKLQVIYNTEPQMMNEDEFGGCVPKQLPLDGRYSEYTKLPAGAICADKFIKYASIAGFQLGAKALGQLHQHLADEPSIETLTQKGQDHLTAEQKEDLKQAFNFYDEDDSGTISIDEFVVACRKVGQDWVTDKDIKALLVSIDKPDLSEITFQDFLCIIAILTN